MDKMIRLMMGALAAGAILLQMQCRGESESEVAGERELFDFDWQFKYFGPESPEEAASVIHAPRGAQNGHSADQAVDGSQETLWVAPNDKPGYELILETGLDIPLSAAVLYWEKDWPQQVQVEIETAGSMERRSIRKQELRTRLDLGGQKVQKLRFIFPDTKHNMWAAVREIELYDMQNAPVKPVPRLKMEAPAQPEYDVSGFKPVQLPHDWAIESPFLKDEPNETGKLPWNGFGWYRKSFDVPASFSAKKQRYYLDFEGVMSHPRVYVNGKKAGEWAYGYSSFRVDITPYLKAGEKNLVAVLASNKPLSSRWYPGAGIYRHVWLTKTSPSHLAYNGICVTTPQVSPESATLQVSTELENTGSEAVKMTIQQQVGKLKARQKSVELAPGETRTVKQSITLPKPELWSCENPHLYTLRTTITQPGERPQVHRTRFGVRTIEWKPDGFYLNGKRVQIQGVCEHHDLGALGSAFYRKAWERKVKKLKEMGCNSIRTSHNPPAPEALDVCDEQGMLVLDELFDIWEAQKYDKVNGYHVDWKQWWKKDVENFVKRDRNHPCVIMWSGGNEISEIVTARGRIVNRELRDEFRKYDTTRPYTVGVNNGKGAWNGFGDDLDVMGFNYKPRMYAEYAQKRPEKPFYGSETASGIGTRGFYLFPLGWRGDEGASAFQVSAYGVAAVPWGYCADVEFAAHDKAPNTAGEYVWTGFDYLGEPTPYNQDASNVGNLQALSEQEKKAIMDHLNAMGNKAPSRSSYFGIIDLAGFPKDVFYLYKSRWDADARFAHLLPHWNWSGREGQVTPVMCFSSGDEAELFVNGKSQGVCRKDTEDKGERIPQSSGASRTAYRFVWDKVVYEPGEISVVVKKDGKPWATDKVVTTGEAASVRAEADISTINGDGYDLCFIELAIVDAQGNVVPTDCRKVSFSAEGPVDLLGFCNGNPIDQTCMQATEQSFFNGRILAIVRGKRGGHGKAVVTVKAEGLPPVKTSIQVQPKK